MRNEISFKSKAWRRFEEALKKFGLKYERRFKAEHNCCGLNVTIEFWVPPVRSYSGYCTHVFFVARHPKQSELSSIRRHGRRSYRVLALVDGKKRDLRRAYFNLRLESGNF